MPQEGLSTQAGFAALMNNPKISVAQNIKDLCLVYEKSPLQVGRGICTSWSLKDPGDQTAITHEVAGHHARGEMWTSRGPSHPSSALSWKVHTPPPFSTCQPELPLN